jgi:hypothetical protein
LHPRLCFSCLAALVLLSACDEAVRKPTYDRDGEAPGSDNDTSVRYPDQDASGEDASDGDPDCDALEPNGSPLTALPLDLPLDSRQASVCQDDEDWFSLELRAGDTVRAQFIFSHDRGDLDAALYDNHQRLVDYAATATDNEVLEFTAPQAGTWRLQIFGYLGATNDYNLLVERTTTGPEPCAQDDLGPNRDPTGAYQLSADQREISAQLCGAEDEFFAADLEAGQEIEVQASGATDGLPLLWLDPSGQELGSAQGAVSLRAQSTGRYTLQIRNTAGASGAYTLQVQAPQPEGALLLRGQVSYDRPWFNPSTMQHRFITAPVRGLTVEWVRQEDNTVLATSATDGLGRYLLSIQGDEPGYLRVLARRRGPEAHADAVTFERRVYAIRSPEPFSPSQAPEGVYDLSIGGGASLSAPFHIMEVVTEGLAWWTTHVAPATAPLHLLWQEGDELDCGTCYRHDKSPSTIYLYGLESDNDALDEAVILHELGHYIQNHFSWDDSPGGSHDGSPADPLLAWAEGWATGWSMIVRQQARYIDTRGGSAIDLDLETPDEEYATFTGQGLGSDISEYLIAALLWDVYDAGQEDPVRADLGVLDPMLGWVVQGQRQRRGANGVDLVDYLDGAYCLGIAPEEDLDALLESYRFPYSSQDKPDCKPQPPLSLRWSAPDRLEVEPSVDTDDAQVLVCHTEGCQIWYHLGSLRRGQRRSVDIPLGTTRVELRAQQGRKRWASALVTPGAPPRPVAQWITGPDAADGAAVVEHTNQ